MYSTPTENLFPYAHCTRQSRV